MAISKIILNGVTQINLTTDTITSSNDIVTGKYGHLNTGERVLGTGQIGGSSTLTTKTITKNGTYLASDDNADGYSSVTVNVTSSGGTTMTATGTVTGNGTNIVQIPCDFEPDLIHIHGDLSADVATRGIATLTILKDMALYIGLDSSTSASVINFDAELNITGYNTDTSSPHATYSNKVLSIDTVINSGSYRWTSGITYSYKLIKFG